LIRVAFVINFKKNNWLGGYNYFTNLFQYIREYYPCKITPVILTNNKEILIKDKILSKFDIIQTNLFFSSNLLIRLINKFLIIIFGKSLILDFFLKKNNISILSHSGFLGRNSQVLSFPWFPDFQEIHYSENFSYWKILMRRINIFLSARNCTKIILSSNSVKEDLKKIDYFAYKKSYVLNHANKVINFRDILPISKIKKKYNIKKKFFFVPNHYWVHKNHILVLKAILLADQRNSFEILSSGQTFDHRNQSHFKNILNFIKINKLKCRYKILGVIPFKDMCSLMYYSVAVINPSKSEGWGNSAEQANLIGKKVLLSDIPVHIEQKKKNYFYFSKDDPISLLNLMIRIIKKKKKTKRQILYEKNILNNKRNERLFVRNYLDLLLIAKNY
jgi:hypothetical protein